MIAVSDRVSAIYHYKQAFVMQLTQIAPSLLNLCVSKSSQVVGI
jgi:hypothetical protein